MVAGDGNSDAAPSGDGEDEGRDSGVVGGGIDAPLAPTLSAAQMEAATIELDQELDYAEGTTGMIDTTGGAWRLIEVPAASNGPTIIQTPIGWLALSRRSLGDARIPSGWQSVLYRSTDGVHWQAVPFAPGRDDLALSDIAYGNGRYVMTGRRYGEKGGGVFWVSEDGERWQEFDQPPLDSTQLLGTLDFAGGKFFAFGFRVLGVSEDGEAWSLLGSDLVQGGAAAYGNDRYVLAGNGPMMISPNAFEWHSAPVDCAIPGACITDPSGNVSQGYQNHLRFVDGRFYSDQMVSEDGEAWEALPGRSPAAHVSGRFIGGGGYVLDTWTPDGPLEQLLVIRPSKSAVTAAGRRITSLGVLDHEAKLPDSVSAPFEDGLTCETASCIIVDSRLYLVPPAGTPRLPDRIPRDAAGEPLLSDDCPRSTMVFCDDYSERTGCVCRPEAPAEPSYCEDVSQFTCAGAFTQREGEWQVSEIGVGGCSCTFVDPNQPAGFGRDCSPEADDCEAPLQCLAIDPVPSPGPPSPARTLCTAPCATDADCPSRDATGYCAGPVRVHCSAGSCQPRECE